MQAIHAHLQETIQTLHRKAIDADKLLTELQKNDKGKFTAIFAKDSIFETHSKRFGPYVEEIARDWQQLMACQESEQATYLPLLIKKIELALKTVSQFQSAVKQ